jgi:putative SOS response-associated peptidase YedK
VTSCAIIVTDANALTRPIHDRMPVVPDKADIAPWLSGAAGTELLKPAAEDGLGMWPVSRRVNKTGAGDDYPTLIEEVAAGSAAGFRPGL